jgi:hypothetical protein
MPRFPNTHKKKKKKESTQFYQLSQFRLVKTTKNSVYTQTINITHPSFITTQKVKNVNFFQFLSNQTEYYQVNIHKFY